MKTVVGLFGNERDARETERELINAGFERSQIHIEANRSKAEDGLERELLSLGVPAKTARAYCEGVRRGGVLETVNAPDGEADKVIAIMNRHTPLGGGDQRATDGVSGASANEQVLPVIEEELSVGKREVQSGGVRVYTRVEEKPVSANVELREEHVSVERRPVDRPIAADDVRAMRDQVIDVVETAEQPVIQKQARVVEEVVVKKDVTSRNETVRDTVKRTDVDVQQLDSGIARFGERMRSDKRYANRNWDEIETSARDDWEKEQPGTWDKMKAKIRRTFEGS